MSNTKRCRTSRRSRSSWFCSIAHRAKSVVDDMPQIPLRAVHKLLLIDMLHVVSDVIIVDRKLGASVPRVAAAVGRAPRARLWPTGPPCEAMMVSTTLLLLLLLIVLSRERLVRRAEPLEALLVAGRFVRMHAERQLLVGRPDLRLRRARCNAKNLRVRDMFYRIQVKISNRHQLSDNPAHMHAFGGGPSADLPRGQKRRLASAARPSVSFSSLLLLMPLFLPTALLPQPISSPAAAEQRVHPRPRPRLPAPSLSGPLVPISLGPLPPPPCL